jgi:hypothetical protein
MQLKTVKCLMQKFPEILLKIIVIVLLLSIAASLASIGRANCSLNEKIVKLDVQVYDMDLSTDIAKINVTLTYENSVIPSDNITVDLDDCHFLLLKNNKGEFIGSSGIYEKPLGGIIGRGQYAPFEDYQLILELSNMSQSSANIDGHDFTIDRTICTATFEGSKRLVLESIFENPIYDDMTLQLI